jgi:hypothetical protein
MMMMTVIAVDPHVYRSFSAGMFDKMLDNHQSRVYDLFISLIFGKPIARSKTLGVLPNRQNLENSILTAFYKFQLAILRSLKHGF